MLSPREATRLRVKAPPRTKLIHCRHPNGSESIITTEPNPKTRPEILLHIGPKFT